MISKLAHFLVLLFVLPIGSAGCANEEKHSITFEGPEDEVEFAVTTRDEEPDEDEEEDE